MIDKKEWNEADNVLCVRLDSLGDVLMTTPALRAIKETWPGHRITLLTSRSGANICPLIPEVDDVITYAPPWMKASAPPEDCVSEFRMIERIREYGFDAAVIFTTFSQSPLPAAFLAFLAEIPLRLAHCRENPYYLLTHWVPESDHLHQSSIRHEVRRQLDLIESVGATTRNEQLSLKVPDIARENARRRLKQIGLDEHRPWIVLHPGATAASRRYPAEGFAKVARDLSTHYGFQTVFTGTASEIELVEAIRRTMRVHSFSLAGKLDVEELSALISISPLLITNNTGPAHIAAALNTPVVDLYALTNSQHTPWQVPHRILYHDVPCKFCYKSVCPMGHHDCLRLVRPESVVEASIELLGEVGVTAQRQTIRGISDD